MSVSSVLLNTDRLYSDFKRSFDEHPITGDLVANLNEDAVTESIINLLFTRPGERLMSNQLIGCGLAGLLFEPITSQTADSIKDSITSVINQYEPRARILNVNVTASPDDETYEATISFGVINIAEVFTISRTLQRVR